MATYLVWLKNIYLINEPAFYIEMPETELDNYIDNLPEDYKLLGYVPKCR